MDGILILIILLGIISIGSIVFEIIAVISLINYVRKNTARRRGIICCVLAAVSAYPPLALIFGYLILRYGMIAVIVINLLMILRFLKKPR